MLSDKFKAGRSVTRKHTGNKQISFIKFIKHVKLNAKKPEYDLIADFEFFDVNCENCLKQKSRIVPLYVMSNEEIQLRTKRQEYIDFMSPDIILKCPKCFQEKRIVDIRRHTNLGTSVPLVFSNEFGAVKTAKSMRDNRITDLLSNEVKAEYERLLALGKSSKGNKAVAKQLEHYIKGYRNIAKKYKGKPFEHDIEALNSSGMNIVKIDNIDILLPNQ